MKNLINSGFAAMIALAAGTSSAQITDYSQDFEGLNQASGTALGDDGWLVGANVFDAGGNFIYNYFSFPAPNMTGAFSNIAAGEGGPDQGAQQLVTFSDYNNADHNDNPTRIIEANFFREYTVDASNVGETWTFEFDAKKGDIAGASTGQAFIKTLDLVGGTFGLIDFETLDTHTLPTTWGTYSLSLEIRPDLVGQIFQVGFLNNASGFEASGVFYDNISLQVPAPASAGVLAMGGLLAARRRR